MLKTCFLPRPNFYGLVLVFSLLLTQTLGLVHRVVHSPLHASHNQTQQVRAHAQHKPVAESDHLFSDHTSDAVCQLFDQLALDGAVPAIFLFAQPIVFPRSFSATFQSILRARVCTHIHARAPPLVEI